MPKVYVVQQTKHNIESAKHFGELRVMLLYKDLQGDSFKMSESLELELVEMEPTDYLLLIGEPRAIGLAMHHAICTTNGQFKILTWDKRRMEYEVGEIDI